MYVAIVPPAGNLEKHGHVFQNLRIVFSYSINLTNKLQLCILHGRKQKMTINVLWGKTDSAIHGKQKKYCFAKFLTKISIFLWKKIKSLIVPLNYFIRSIYIRFLYAFLSKWGYLYQVFLMKLKIKTHFDNGVVLYIKTYLQNKLFQSTFLYNSLSLVF